MKLFKNISIILFGFVLTGVGCTHNKEVEPAHYLDDAAQEAFKYKVIKYAGKLAPKATETSKFDKAFEIYYKNLASTHDLMAYYPDEASGITYFMLSRIAPSLYVKKIAIGGRLKSDQKGNITFYEEGFRTYKMEPEVLREKALEIFRQYIQEKSLEKYLYKNSQPEEWIEFPDENTWYDTTRRQWQTKLINPQF